MVVSFKFQTGLIILLCFFLIHFSDAWSAWSGNYQVVRRATSYWKPYCVSWYWWWGCSWHRYRWYTEYYYESRCQPGWTHNGNRNCNIPICRPSCGNHGKCTSPNRCQCDSSATGPYCRTVKCSYRKPCYPGECYNTNQCRCEKGFKNSPDRSQDGCLSFDESVETMFPVISRCTATIMNIRRTDNRTKYKFVMDGTNTTETEQIWSNQKRFNVLSFEIESMFPKIEYLPKRPAYVYEAEFGIVGAQIQVNVTKVSREGSPIRDPGVFKTHHCPDISSRQPEDDMSNCTLVDDQFTTLIEHGDWMEVNYQAESGGFRELRNTDQEYSHYDTQNYTGLKDIKQVKFLFDFIAPKYCGENGSFKPCPADPVMLKVEKEFTQDPIKPIWHGWQDDLSGMKEYFVEVFRLLPDPYGRLIERHPLGPLFSIVVKHTDVIEYPQYTPDRAGVYSVLMEARDMANNSRIARRFVIYDTTSDIKLNTEEDGKLYVSSAYALNNYTWQTNMNDDGTTTFVIRWTKHFINPTHEKGKYLNEIMEYPIQFKEIQDDGVLFSQKYVAKSLDDYEGNLTREGIKNFLGIVKFEINTDFTLNTEGPDENWKEIQPLAETTTVTERIEEGRGFRVWVRAHDVMGHVKADSTYIQVDTSKPAISGRNDTDTDMTVNFEGGKYNFTTRIIFKAADPHSGVHEIGFKIAISTTGKTKDTTYSGREHANMKPADEYCKDINGVCYTADQTLDLDNCWFLVAKEDLDISSAVITITAYNNAMLNNSLQFVIPQINQLHGLEKYSGPENFRIERKTSMAFRIAWDLPDKLSCYGLADIVLVIASIDGGRNKTETHVVPSANKFFDLLGRSPNTNYRIIPSLRLPGGFTVSEGIKMAVRTPETESTGVSDGVVAGVAVGVIALVAIGIAVFIILIRRGYFQPVQRGVTRAKTIVQRKARQARQNIYVGASYSTRDTCGEELYIYGGMDFKETDSWYISRSDVTFETLLKTGQFANIYKATLKGGHSPETVVAKTLKENFSQDDETLMKAKINFTATVVGSHPNIVKFVGAVVDDTTMGPFILYEYCERGALKEYLQEHQGDVNMEVHESLFRFGLDIAKGMEYLASKKIVHRRLAARNILLNYLTEVKIAGFGPQPIGGGEEDGDAEKGKKERIPIKWMSPECMSSTADATEKTDVWSYAVVLWEIFTLGSTPYENIRGRDLPGRLKKGERLPKPENSDDTWYGVMQQCWAFQPAKRPTFSDIRNQLDGLFETAPGEDYYYYKR